jgi:hypothetical protein
MPETAVSSPEIVAAATSLKQKLETGLAALLKECPPQPRLVLRQFHPLVLGYLRSASEESIREALIKVKEAIDGLLCDTGGE